MKHVILVDEHDNEIATMPVIDAHMGDGAMHRAFSIHVMRSDGKVLITKRSGNKLLWPGFWSNSVCSHPLPGERVIEGAKRRLREEAGIEAEPRWQYAFAYQAAFPGKGSENEYCHVLTAYHDGDISPDPNEISEFKWVEKDELLRLSEGQPGLFTPWSIQEFNQLFRS